MTVWNIVALVIGIIATLACLALAAFGLLVFIAAMAKVKEEYKNWEDEP